MATTCNEIMAQRDHRHWSAWFADAPEAAYGGTSPRHAVERLLDAHPERGFTLDQLVPVEGWERGTDLRFSVATDRRTCPDCGGSGQYVGLQTLETCRTCGGEE